MRRWGLFALLAACGNSYALQEAATDGGADGGSVGVSADGGSVAAVPPPAACDLTADGKDSLPCATDDFAIFVDANATAGGPGTKEAPLRSVGDGLLRAASTGRGRVYVCGVGPYVEHVTVVPSSVARLIGGFACGTWTPVANTSAQVAPRDPGYALQMTNVTGAFQVEDMTFALGSGTAANPSTIAVFVASSPSIVLKRVTITTGSGATGAIGTTGETGTSTPLDLTGSNAPTATGGAPAKQCTCSTGGTTTGGNGGTAPTGMGGNGLPALGFLVGGVGQSATNCRNDNDLVSNGGNSANAADAPSTTAIGALSATGWAPASGATGATGGVGQGGGGGGVSNSGGTGAGGGGGCGGCGSTGGSGGGGGGASIALLAFDSPVQLLASTLSTGSGGSGGVGGPDGPIGTGGIGGTGAGEGCSGAHGGSGGKGGSGSGGAGGVAAAIFYSGASPTNLGSTLTAGSAGGGGQGGTPGTNDGPAGIAGQLLAAP